MKVPIAALSLFSNQSLPLYKSLPFFPYCINLTLSLSLALFLSSLSLSLKKTKLFKSNTETPFCFNQ